MNAHTSSTPASQLEAARQPLLVTDEELLLLIARLADERGTPMLEIVRLAVEDYLRRHDLGEKAPQWLQDFWRDHPMPLPSGLKADKVFYDALYDES